MNDCTYFLIASFAFYLMEAKKKYSVSAKTIGKNFTAVTATASSSRITEKRWLKGHRSLSSPLIQYSEELVSTSAKPSLEILIEEK
jgi:hypothetical protein